MRIDFSEPECRNCYHCRTSGVLNTQESEPSNVIGSSVTSMPVSSGPVQALGHDSPVVGSTSTSYPVQALGHDSAAVGSTSTSSPGHSSSAISFGSPPAATTSVISGPAQSVAPTISSYGAFGSPSQRPAFQAPVQDISGSGASATSTSSTSSPVHSSSPFRLGSAPAATTSVSSGPTQALGPATFQAGSLFQAPVQVNYGSGASATSTSSTSSPFHSSSPFGSAPAFTSVSSAPTQALGPTTFGFGAFSAPTPPRFGTMQDPVQASASTTSTSFSFGPAHNFAKPASASLFGNSVAFARPDVGYSPVPSSSTTTVVFGTTPVSVSSPFGPTQAPVQASASSTSTFLPFGCVPASPASGSSLFTTGFGSPPASSSFNLFGPNASITASVFDTPTESVCSHFAKPASASLFGNSVAFARPDVGYSPVPSSSTTTVVFGTTPVSVSSPFGPTQAPVQASASSTSTFLPFGCVPASLASGSSLFTSGFGSPPASSSFNLFGPNASITASVFDTPTESVCSQFGSKSGLNFHRSPASGFTLFGSAQDFPKTTNSVCASSTEKTPLNSFFPGFGVGYLPGSSSNLFRPNPSTTTNFGGGLIGGGVKTSSPQPFGFSAATTLLPSSSFSSSATFSSNSNIESHPFASHEWSCRAEQGSRYPGYKPTPDGQTQKGDIYISISASNPYLHKSHEELRWEDYKQGVKGGSFPAAHASPIGSGPDAVFSPSTASPSIFPSRSIPDYDFCTTGVAFGPLPAGGGVTTPSSSCFRQTNAVYSFSTLFPSSSSPSSTTVPPINSSVQRSHETAAVSSPAPGCTACGATTSSSASGYFTFNGASNPPSAATSLPGLFFPTSGSGPMMFGTTLAAQATTLAAQATTPALQAYPVQGYILLPFAALSLQ